MKLPIILIMKNYSNINKNLTLLLDFTNVVPVISIQMILMTLEN